MQFSGSFLQSVLHLKRSQASQPMGGVLASPLSSARAPSTHAQANISVLRSPHGKPITLQQHNSTLSISTSKRNRCSLRDDNLRFYLILIGMG